MLYTQECDSDAVPQTFDATKGYLYVQFQALKNGYIDDVEFAIVND
jgi:hypothetical protein